MTAEEIICTFMSGPKPPLPIETDGETIALSWGWELTTTGYEAGDDPVIIPRRLDLNALHEVEEKLTDDQWKPYVEQLLKWKSLDKIYVEQMFWLLHATAQQKITALAAVLRGDNLK